MGRKEWYVGREEREELCGGQEGKKEWYGQREMEGRNGMEEEIG